jgi:tripartite-type tricarboxylate transporter receptor subunit TctC
MFAYSALAVPQIKAGKVRALAVAAKARNPSLPDVPTVAESGYPGYEANSWNGMVAPAGTPAAIIKRLNAEMLKILASKEVIDYMTADGAEPAGSTPEKFSAYIRAEHAKWEKVIRAAHLRRENP